jgi:hypothetical protein
MCSCYSSWKVTEADTPADRDDLLEYQVHADHDRDLVCAVRVGVAGESQTATPSRHQVRTFVEDLTALTIRDEFT